VTAYFSILLPSRALLGIFFSPSHRGNQEPAPATFDNASLGKMTDGTIAITTQGGQEFSKHFYTYMDTGRSNLKVR
jgi:hypothetical protein